MLHESTQAIKDLKIFQKIDNPTPEQILEMVLDNRKLNFVDRIVGSDGLSYRERGCEGPCGCTGMCRELVPFTTLDRLNNEHYAATRKVIMDDLEINA
jgi:hypothetical protein